MIGPGLSWLNKSTMKHQLPEFPLLLFRKVLWETLAQWSAWKSYNLDVLHLDNLLLHASMLAGININSCHLSTSKEVTWTRDFDKDEIVYVLKSRIRAIKRDNKSIKTGTYILKFGKPYPPQNLIIGYLSLNVDVFIPNSLHCFQCQKLGLYACKKMK